MCWCEVTWEFTDTSETELSMALRGATWYENRADRDQHALGRLGDGVSRATMRHHAECK